MAKIAFTKLGLKTNNEVKTFTWNDQVVEVKMYLPVDDKLQLIADVVNRSADNNNFVNPVKTDVFFHIGLIEWYTNIKLTDKQKEDAAKTYDLLLSNGFIDHLIQNMNEAEYEDILRSTRETIIEIYKQKNSVLGILEAVSADYSNLDLDATKIQEKLADPENLELLKGIMTKLG